MEPDSDVSTDCMLRGDLYLTQPRQGYRFNIDAVLLAGFAQQCVVTRPSEVVDIGAGCGIVGLILARRWPGCRVTLVELQSLLARCAQQNVVRNAMENSVRVVVGDLRKTELWAPSEATSPIMVVSNPPFFQIGTGRPSPQSAVARARHEIDCSLSELVTAASAGVPHGGFFALIHDAKRRRALLEELRQSGFWPTQIRSVRPYPQAPVKRILVYAERRRDAEKWTEEYVDTSRDLVIHDRPQVYSAEVKQMLGDDSED